MMAENKAATFGVMSAWLHSAGMIRQLVGALSA